MALLWSPFNDLMIMAERIDIFNCSSQRIETEMHRNEKRENVLTILRRSLSPALSRMVGPGVVPLYNLLTVVNQLTVISATSTLSVISNVPSVDES